MASISASEFPEQCLVLVERVARTGEAVTILKQGKPVAQLVPSIQVPSQVPQHELFGTVILHGDVMEPVLPADAWQAVRGEIY